MRRALSWVALAAGVVVCARACADEPMRFAVERGASGERLIRALTPLVVPGELHQPHAFYVLQRTPLEIDLAPLERDFLPRILDATRRHPF